MHFLRIHVHRPGEAAERLLAELAARHGTPLLAHGPEFRRLQAHGDDRDELLAGIQRDLDRIALVLGIPRWGDHLEVS